MFSFLFAILLAATPAQAQSPAAPTQTTEAPKEDPAVTALALKIYGQMRTGKIDESLLSEQMNKALTPELLAQNKPVFDQLGDPTKLTLQSRKSSPQGTAYDYLADFAAAQLHVRIYIDPTGKVAGYNVAP